ncbi:hypothetical protein CRUP_023661 [Coryphaenoides rupestris]|nr:hypothetical protein CRUP_023661 [Coryphaenoides rupestris]
MNNVDGGAVQATENHEERELGPSCLISPSEVSSFIERCLMAVGTQAHHAHSLAQDGEPVVEKETGATALVDGKNLLGPVVGNFCMALALKKAKEAGVGWVVAHGSNHYGIAGYYAMQALKENMIGMSFTNTSPLVVPTRGKECTLGTNPISMAAPANDGDSFVLDMATSAVALGKGILTPDPQKVLQGGGLVPIGGSEATGSNHYGIAGYYAMQALKENMIGMSFTNTSPLVVPTRGKECTLGTNPISMAAPANDGDSFVLDMATSAVALGKKVLQGGYKGYGLGMMVEVFCGILSGAQYSKHVRTWKVTDRVANLANPDSPVLTAGDPERAHLDKIEEMGGIPYHLNVVNFMNECGKRVGVSPLLPCDKLISD